MIMSRGIITVNSIFEKDKDGYYTKRARLYQDIIRYSVVKLNKNIEKDENEFKHRELARWLLQNNLELVNRYKEPSTRHITISNRVEDTQERIKKKIEDLVRMKLIARIGRIKQEKGTGSVDLYAYRQFAYFIAYIIEFIGAENKAYLATKILDLIKSFADVNKSFTMNFVYRFFKKCDKTGVYDKVILYFIEVILPNSQIYNGRDLLKTFLGITNICNWILPFPDIFLSTMEESEETEKMMVLFRIKMDIEEHYNQNYLREEIDILEFNIGVTNLKEIKGERDRANFISVPGKEWESVRYHNARSVLLIAIPAFCGTCKSDRVFLIDTFSYLDNFRQRHLNGSGLSRSIGGKCTKCDSYIVGGLMRFPYYNISAPWIESDFTRFI
jgi:hypothetical protein